MDILLREVLNSLKRSPEDWDFTHFEATNRETGVVIWIANSWYATQVTFPGGFTLPEGEKVSALSTFFGWATWRGRVIRRCQTIRRSRYLAERASMRRVAAIALDLAEA